MNEQNGAMRIVGQREVQALVGLSRTTLWRMEREGRFPLHLQLGHRRIGWIVDDIQNWINSRPRGFREGERERGGEKDE